MPSQPLSALSATGTSTLPEPIGRVPSSAMTGRRRGAWSLLASCCVFAALGCGDAGNGAPSAAPHGGSALQSGTLQKWPEAKAHLLLDVRDSVAAVHVGAARRSGLDAFWSVASTSKTGGTAFFYADFFRPEKETRVALSPLPRVSSIRDASTLDYSRESVGPVAVGGVVVIEHVPTRRYLALVLDAVTPTDPKTAGAGPYAYADVTWYLSEDGDFSAAR